MRIILIFLIFSFSFFTTGAGRFAGSGADLDSAEGNTTNNNQESTQDTQSNKTSQVYEEPTLHRAVRSDNYEAVIDILLSAIRRGHRNGDLYFLSSGEYLNINTRNSRGQSPLTLAVLLSRLNFVGILLGGGASLDLKNNMDRAALEYADSSVKKLLKQNGQSLPFCQHIFRR